jgi:hypothetical protein
MAKGFRIVPNWISYCVGSLSDGSTRFRVNLPGFKVPVGPRSSSADQLVTQPASPLFTFVWWIVVDRWTEPFMSKKNLQGIHSLRFQLGVPVDDYGDGGRQLLGRR